MPRPSDTPAWRHGNIPPQVSQRRPGGEPVWRKETETRLPVRRRWSKPAQVGVAATVFMLLVGLLIWASFWLRPPKDASLVLIGARYRENLLVPPNIYGWQTLRGLADLEHDSRTTFVWGSERLRLQQEPRELRIGDDWASGLNDVQENTIVIFLALHGGADGEGAYLLPNDAAAEENRLRLTKVLDRLKQLPPNKNKLLVLEAVQMSANWQLGMLDNGFIPALKNLDERIADVPNLVVLSANDVNQRAWISRDWRRTVFGHHLIEGLRGAAADADNDGRLNAWELFLYVQPSVQRWVRDNRDAAQTPILLPAGKDGKLGEQRARKMDLTVVHGYTPPELPQREDEERKDEALLDELGEAWKRYENLASPLPSPADYAPQLWRRYQGLQLRREQLAWAGDPEGAATLAGRLMELEQEIERGRRLPLNSFQNTLTMPAVAGVTTAASDQLLAQFHDLWNAPAQEAGKRWAALQSSPPAQGDGRLLRLQFYEFLLEKAAKDPSNNLENAYQWLHVVDDAVAPRPAEVHFLAMVRRDRPRTASPEYDVLLTLALRVRVQAEKAALAFTSDGYAFSEEVRPWIQDLMAQADKDRRLGHDLLFAADKEHWQQAVALLQKAEATYTTAQTRAAVVRKALSVRNQVLSALPYHSEWLARRALATTASQKEIDDSLKEVAELWQNAHRLAEMLETPRPTWIDQAPPPSADDPQPRSLSDQTEVVQRTFSQIEDRFLRYCQSLADVDTQSVWRDAEDALTVPFRDYALRRKLAATMWRSARRLLMESRTLSGETDRADAERYLDGAKEEQKHKEHGRAEGRMALSVLGKRWFDQCRSAEPQLENFQQVWHRLETFAVESLWRPSLEKAGEEVGRRWQKLPAEINRLVRSPAAAADPEQVRRSFRDADRLARLVDGAGSVLLSSNPADSYRRLRVEELLAWQAQRTWEDHWYAEDPNAEPYYRAAGLLFLGDAQQLDPWQSPRPIVAEMLQQMKQPGGLVGVGPRRLGLTTERRFSLTYQLTPEEGANLPDGFSVAWMEAGNHLEMIANSPTPHPNPLPQGEREQTRLLRRVEKNQPTDKIEYTLRSPLLLQAEAAPPPLPRVEQTAATLHGLFRGQKITRTTDIDLFPLAEQIWSRSPLPSAAGIAVRTPKDIQDRFGTGNGAVVIVLDCSGSMGPQPGQKFGPTAKFHEAVDALKQVLSKLPKGTSVSLWVFGQAMGPGKTVEVAENTIRRIQDPVRWNPEDAAQLKALMGKVEYPALEPWNESPIMRTILQAKEDLRAATGFKTLLVITDGMDNRFEKDRVLNPAKKDIPTVFREAFNDSGIMVNVVGFKVENQEEKKAREQFEVVRDLTLPGKFYAVTDSKDLVGVLENALRQRLHYRLDDADNVPVLGTPADGMDVSRIGENIQWFPRALPPGGYKARVHADKRLTKDVVLNAGDLLLIDLADTTRGVQLERGIYSQTDYPFKKWREKGGWRLAVLQNQQLGGQALQMLATLEKSRKEGESVLQFLKPRMVWMEIQPASDTFPFSQRWNYQPGYPAPAWSVNVPQWRAGNVNAVAAPSLQVWWNPDQEPAIAFGLDRQHDFQTLAEIANRPIQIEGDKVIVESVQLEDHLVEVRPGQRETKPCLVVRLSHAPGKPIWAEVSGVKVSGQEHRFFTKANKYTGLFWPVTQADAEKITRLGFLSLTAFKKDAERRGFKIEMRDLPPPAADDVRPQGFGIGDFGIRD